MLLRRVIEHVKSENWFAVFLDLVIVVIGVFIGIQVSNWNDWRVTQQRTEALTVRLEDDFGVDAWVANNMLRYHEDVFENANRVMRDLTGQGALSDEEFLIAAFRASQYLRFVPSSSTYNELVATGGLELVAKSNVGGVATIFYGSKIIDEMEAEGKSSAYRYLFRAITPIDVQRGISEACGDRNLSVRDFMDGVSSMGYMCTLKLPTERLSVAASALRQKAELPEALRYRIATLATHINDFGIIVDAMTPYRASEKVLANSSQFVVFKSDELAND